MSAGIRNYLLKRRNTTFTIIVKSTLNRIIVATGKTQVTGPLVNEKSPGSLPNPVRPSKKKTSPATMMAPPTPSNTLPIWSYSIARQPFYHSKPQHRNLVTGGLLALVLLLATGCLEQLQSPRLASGALNNFFLHLYAGELDDARAYFAPGLVERSDELNNSIQDASTRLRGFEIRRGESRTEPLENGEIQETLAGEVRPRTSGGAQAVGPDEGWQKTDIVTARMVERGPGWRILVYELKCCPAP